MLCLGDVELPRFHRSFVFMNTAVTPIVPRRRNGLSGLGLTSKESSLGSLLSRRRDSLGLESVPISVEIEHRRGYAYRIHLRALTGHLLDTLPQFLSGNHLLYDTCLAKLGLAKVWILPSHGKLASDVAFAVSSLCSLHCVLS